YGFTVKARDADVVHFTRETFRDPRDVYVANTDLGNMRKMSHINPQQDDYRWGSTELVEWVSLDGDHLQGILHIPDDIDYSKKYPMITYFYEKSSQNLNRYRTPAPSGSTINISYFVSNGYVVFMPDIPYKIGYPGESAVSAVVTGVSRVLAEHRYVDPDKLGIQGQSWGGYQVAYLVTETDMFAAAGAGAPVSNMFSAYGGIRWGSGLVRQLQYESGQSRLGGTMWEVPMRYWENSPIFFADKIKTPLLMMHNDKDGAVPWWQGIELFTALHRLKKPSWLLVYNGESHGLRQRKNRKDLSVRLSQFFDHYLKDAAMPVWMADGIPAVMKGKTYGFELKDKGGN
ncbi:MAG: S9 family peptidase, partial [Armatimonadetes bacterium]|nr:S9 family peptidase [Armatimonadota bacterium]